MSKKKTLATVLSQKELSLGIYELWIETELAQYAGPGQFVGVYTDDASKLLPRPISICDVKEPDGDDPGALRLVYRVTREGAGTDLISKLVAGDKVYILGILGNGYDISVSEGKDVVLMGGGIGIPPMLCLADRLNKSGKCKSVRVVLGYRDSNFFLKEDFEAAVGKENVLIATEDGSFGTKGNVLNVMNELDALGKGADMVMACGPMPMLRAIAAYADPKKIDAYISLEERMACGVGACLGCITKTKEVDHHSYVNNTRICTDGPVFKTTVLDI